MLLAVPPVVRSFSPALLFCVCLGVPGSRAVFLRDVFVFSRTIAGCDSVRCGAFFLFWHSAGKEDWIGVAFFHP